MAEYLEITNTHQRSQAARIVLPHPDTPISMLQLQTDFPFRLVQIPQVLQPALPRA
jgi:hypothetical protein